MKVQTAFRLDKELVDILKAKAKAQKRSLNNYIEFLLYNYVGDVPNSETKKAIDDAEKDFGLSEIDNLEAYKRSLLKDSH